MNACLPCRKVKVRCRPSDDDEGDSKCERCARKSLNCIFQEHRRGRKPGTRISKRKDTRAHILGEASARPVNMVQPAPATTPLHDYQTPVSQIAEGVLDTERGNLQPSGLLNHEAMKGKFSLRCILSTSDGDRSEPLSNSLAVSPEDPIGLGLVNLSIAKSLFENFMDVLNPYISQLDPVLHTFSHVRHKSAFLLSATLAVAAKAFNPALYDRLHEHAHDLFTSGFRHGTKSTETAQAILILTYWKEPQDTRAWTSLGYVIRMCIDLGWHNLAPASPNTLAAMSEAERREARNVERTWYVLFVYDRSMSLQTGKPWMMERNDFIESIDAWCNDPMAIANDLLLGALVTLRLMTSSVFRVLGPRPRRNEGAPLHNTESLLTLINERINEWENRWIRAVEAKSPADEESCHPFLVHFYGTHLRLQLFSLPLHDVVASSPHGAKPSLELIWVAYSSAMDMLQLISNHSSRLYFAQDSIHVMTAYGAAFLVKMLYLAPETMVAKVHSSIVSSIRGAALVFSQQAAPPGSTCALQSKFLDNVISNLLEKQPTDSRGAAGTANTQGVTLDLFQNDHVSEDYPRLPGDAMSLGLDPVDATGPDLAVMQGRSDLLFSDDDNWTELFATAGFNTQDGTFLV
ncbi:hypothetical protein B0T10DRAFT_76029 [Thelonectria olida]|uniref:Zn(2)-C6 fungal-type domain-containing protein n=1 Tax=Thelonectria olida TaxID=1576542 RepID=A0A9P9AMR6_9HYPO|nr:hypothetical protein B0T10DRAFT_76029 [Thelonectria olida]